MKIAVEPFASDNPFIRHFTDALQKTGAEVVPLRYSRRFIGEQDVVIIHFPTLFMGGDDLRSALRVFRQLLSARLRHGTKLVWIAHNVSSHDRPRTPVRTALFLSQVDGIIYLSEHSRTIIRQSLKPRRGVKEMVTVHGTYPGEAPPVLSVKDGDKLRLLSFGLVRPYKGWEQLIEAVSGFDRLVELRLVGKTSDADYADRLSVAAAASGCTVTDFRDDLLTTAEIEDEIDRADGVVLPYRDILNSGAAIHALSRLRPVLVPAIGAMPELAGHVGEDWVSLFEGEIDPSHIAAFLDRIAEVRGSRPDLSTHEWSRVVTDLAGWLPKLTAGK